MALREQTPRAAQRRDQIMTLAHGKAEQACSRALRSFLRKVIAACHAALGVSLTAAADASFIPPELFTQATAEGWWAESVAEEILPALRAIWATGHSDTTTLHSSSDEAAAFLAQVRDRLSPTTTPSLPADAFERARVVLATESAAGSSIPDIAQRLAAEFSWDDPASYWRRQKASVRSQIGAILDPIGPPGDPVRELARLSDPRVRALQAANAEATKHIDAVESTWKTRATTIARTESTAAFNYGSLHAYAQEGVVCVRWIAAHDSRTRHSHRQADGEVVRLGSRFTLTDLDGNTSHLLMPGDPSAPARETANCRCTTIASDCG